MQPSADWDWGWDWDWVTHGSRLDHAWATQASRKGHAWVEWNKCLCLQRKLKKAGWGALKIAENCQNRVIAKIEKQKPPVICMIPIGKGSGDWVYPDDLKKPKPYQ